MSAFTRSRSYMASKQYKCFSIQHRARLDVGRRSIQIILPLFLNLTNISMDAFQRPSSSRTIPCMEALPASSGACFGKQLEGTHPMKDYSRTHGN